MHWKGFRLGNFENSSSKRQSFVEVPVRSRHSEHVPRSSSPLAFLPVDRHSDSAPHPHAALTTQRDRDDLKGKDDGRRLISRASVDAVPVPEKGTHADMEGYGVPATSSATRRKRFSFMRFRYASDPQLSATYARTEQNNPPVPSLPPPTIITTAPTGQPREPVKRQENLNARPPSGGTSMEEVALNRAVSIQNHMLRLRHGARDSTDTPGAENNVAMSRVSDEEPGRLSTTSMRSVGGDHLHDSIASSASNMRFSESSRSDHSVGDRAVPKAFVSHEDRSSTGRRFKLSLFKRSRAPLFPLPPRDSGIEPNQPQSVAVSRSIATSADASPEFRPSDNPEFNRVSPLPSPARSNSRLFRANSSRSAKSTRSLSLGRNSLVGNALRPSSIVGSLIDIQDEQRSTSPIPVASARTSTSTTGRKSFGDIFNVSHRLRPTAEHSRSGSPGTPFSSVRETPYPAREDTDSPATYLARLQESIPSGFIAGVLARSDDDFFKVALRKYLRGFSFFQEPIDMSIRKLLMAVELPKETQQIDRVLQAFSDRYHECNPGIFASTDQAYFVAFSILILHTDVFNKNNKRKMQKHDYIKNIRGEGISDDILGCFYENTSYTPFIHVEDVNVNAKHLPRTRRTIFNSHSSDLARIAKEPVDPYALILEGKLDTLRPTLKDVMHLEDTYSCYGTFGPPNMNNLHAAFAKASTLQIVSARSRPDAFLSPSSIDNPADSHPGLVNIKVAKVGLLWRKDSKKKRTRSPWQEWGALLTLSQLYLFKDVHWVKSLIAQQENSQKSGQPAVVFKPPLTDFKPDGIMSSEHAVALLDSSYRKHKHAFVFVRQNSLEEVFLANTEADMNDWLAKLNYAAAFRTTGVRPKGMLATKYEAQRQRMDRFISVKSDHSLQTIDKEPSSPTVEDVGISRELTEARKQQIAEKIRETEKKLLASQTQLEGLLRNARHLQVLTPVHARAREQVIMAAGRMSAKLKWVRQDIWRTRCYREVLVRDLGGEDTKLTSATVSYLECADSQLDPKTSASSVDCVPTQQQASVSDQDPVVPSESLEGSNSAISSLPHSGTGVRKPSIPLSVITHDINRQFRRLSGDISIQRAKSLSSNSPANRLEPETSVLSHSSGMHVSGIGSQGSEAPNPRSSFDGGDEPYGESDPGDSLQARKKTSNDNNADQGQKPEAAQEPLRGEQTSKTRRSLHRSLRETYHARTNSQHRKKARDSMSSAGELADDQGAAEGESLSRKSPNFTLHGKKASVITFGSEWQDMSPEERLKARKPNPSEERRRMDHSSLDGTESVVSGSAHDGRPQSRRSASTLGKDISRHEDTSDSRDTRQASFSEGMEAAPTTGSCLAGEKPSISSIWEDDQNDEQPTRSEEDTNIQNDAMTSGESTTDQQ